MQELPEIETVAAEVAVAQPIHNIDEIPLFIAHVADDPEMQRILGNYYLSPGEVSVETSEAEAAFGIKTSLYFYVGRAHPSFGDFAFAFPLPDHVTNVCEGDCSYFDTGGYFWGYIHSAQCAADCRRPCCCQNEVGSSAPIVDPCTRRAMPTASGFLTPCASRHARMKGAVENTTWSLAELRTRFWEYLNDHFDSPSDYWNGVPPSRTDRDGIISCPPRNFDWRAWTVEVRLHQQHQMLLCEAWCCSKEADGRILRELVDGPSANFNPLQRLADRRLLVADDEDYTKVLERWMFEKTGL